MNPAPLGLSADLSALDRACARIAPTWPLDRLIAVNPFWEMVEAPIDRVAALLGALSGVRLLMPRAWFREQYQQGRFRPEHLQQAIDEAGSSVTVAELEKLLQSPEPLTSARARVMDVADAQRDVSHQLSWRDFVTSSLSQFCASYFDDGQATMRPSRAGGLYATWRRHAQTDLSPARLMGLRAFGQLAAALPPTADAMAERALDELGVPEAEVESYLLSLLLDVNGWAAWCAYLQWTARLAGGSDVQLRELLVIRLAWEWLLLQQGGRERRASWTLAMAQWPHCDDLAFAANTHDWLPQRALELSWQQEVYRGFFAAPAPAAAPTPAVQAVFCIDVRSEVFRRALEAQGPQTLGFAGFFGLPVEYQPLGAVGARPQLPGLLLARLRVTDEGLPTQTAGHRVDRLAASDAFRALKGSASAGFSYVESMGPLCAVELLREVFGRPRAPLAETAGLTGGELALRRPRVASLADGGALDLEARCELAAGALRAMSLTRGFARVVALLGHGSQTRNNAQAAALDCGACCGQTGEVNARAAAALFNEPAVREGLSRRGIEVPSTTRFVAGLHNTTTDEVTLFELEDLPPSHLVELTAFRAALLAAGDTARRERAPRLGLSAGLNDSHLRDAVEARAHDWAQVRPEWGLAGNAAFIVAPRSMSKHLDLRGRSFLHDYRFEEDEGFRVLELIMTAPMVVTHWINLQYYASTVDNLRYGSGNKVLHNVVGGHLGVFEGNGGDLRIGLSKQSLHDGTRWIHTPLRLSVFIAAPREAIVAVLEKHPKVRALVENDWLFLFQLDGATRTVLARRDGGWERVG